MMSGAVLPCAAVRNLFCALSKGMFCRVTWMLGSWVWHSATICFIVTVSWSFMVDQKVSLTDWEVPPELELLLEPPPQPASSSTSASPRAGRAEGTAGRKRRMRLSFPSPDPPGYASLPQEEPTV